MKDRQAEAIDLRTQRSSGRVKALHLEKGYKLGSVYTTNVTIIFVVVKMFLPRSINVFFIFFSFLSFSEIIRSGLIMIVELEC